MLKSLASSTALLILSITFSQAQTTYKVGATGGTHTTISSAYLACTSSTINYTIEILPNYNISEASTGSITLGANTASSIIIRPQLGNNSFIITTAIAAPLFILNGAKNITIDGRPGGTGTTGLMTLQNTNSNAAGGSLVVQFTSGATNNTIQYCTINGSNPNTTSTSCGVICFKAAGSDSNTIDNCTIQAAGGIKPAVAIISRLSDLGAGNNLNITISNCNIVDFTTKAIWIANPANTGWRILNNSFYQTSTIALTNSMEVISIANGSGYVISGNYIGGQAPKCLGSNYTLTSGTYTTFRGINFALSSAGTNTITNNTIQKISFSGSNYSNLYAFAAIYLRGNGDFTCGGGPGLGNTIGSLTTSGSIKFNNPSATGGIAGFCAIRDSSSSSNTGFSKTISYNSIGGIDINTGIVGQISDIISITNGNIKGAIVDNNTIGTTTAPINNSGVAPLNIINNIHTSPFTATFNTIQGINQTNLAATNGMTIIKCNGNASWTCTDNTISNITSTTNALVSIINYAGGSLTSPTGYFSNNTIQSITLSNTGTNSALNVFDISSPSNINIDVNTIGSTSVNNISVAGNSVFNGIILTNGSSPASITDNTIQNVTLTSTGTSGGFIGVGISGGNSIITCSGNSILNISCATASTVGYGAIYINNLKTGHSIYGSYISNIAFKNTTAASINNGIYLSCSGSNGGKAEGNLIIGLSNASSSASAKVVGIEYTNSSNWTIQNNIILLDNVGGNAAISLTGINISSSGTGFIYHNTVKLSGTQSGTVTSSCITSNSTNGNFAIKNNIFQNIRTGTGFLYAESYPNGPTFITNYNYLECVSTTVAAKGGSFYNITTWNATGVPLLLSVSGTATIDATGKVTSAAFTGAGTGTAIPAVPTDIIGTTRNATTPWMGAYEGPVMKISSISPTTICAGTNISIAYILTGSANSGNVYKIELSSATGSFATPTTISTGLTGSPMLITIPPITVTGSAYRIRITSSNPGLVSADNGTNLSITALPTITPIASFSVCADQASAPVSATLTNATGAIWTTNGTGTYSPSNTTLNPNYIFSAADIASGSVKLTATSTGNSCLTVAGSTTVTITPTPTISAGPNQTICTNTSTVTLAATFTIATGMTWSSTGSGSFTPSITSANAIYTPSAADKSSGTVTITAKTTGNGTCNAVSNTLVITINPAPTATFAAPTAICSGATTSIPLSSSPTGATFTWTASGAPTGHSSGTGNNISQTLSGSGTATYIVTPTLNGCTGTTATISQVVNPTPTISAGPNQTICANTTTVALAATFTNATGMTWSSTGSGSFAPSITSANATYTPSVGDKSSGTVTLTATTTGTGCPSVLNTLVITINPVPTVTFVAPTAICSGATTSIPLTSSPTGATFAWTASGAPTGYSSGTGNNITQTLTGTGTVTYIVTPTLNSCTGNTATIAQTVNAGPTISAGANQTICATTTTVALAATFTNATGMTWSSSGTGTFTPSITNANAIYTPSVADKSSGTVTLTATTTGTGACPAVLNTSVITITPAPTISSGADQTICANTSTVTIAATFTNATGITWTSTGSGSFAPSITSANATYTPSAADKSSGTVTLTATTATGICTSVSNTLVLTIKPLPTVTFVAPTAICSGTTTSIPLSSSPTGATFTWTASGAPTGYSSGTGNNITQTLSGSGTATYIVTPTLNGCTGTTATISQAVTPVPTISAGANQTICASTPTVAMTATFTNATGMTWSSTGSGSFAPSITSANATYTPSAGDKSSGTVTLTATTTGTGACLAVLNTLVVTIKPLPTVTFVAPTAICSGATTSIPLASSPTGATFTWTASGAPTGYSGGAGNNISQTLTGNGTVTYIVTPTLNSCTGNTASITQTVNAGPTISAGTNQTICANTSNAVLAASFTNATGMTWSSSGSGSFAPSITSANATYTPSVADKSSGSVTLTATTTGSGTCTSISNNLVITITPVPTISAGANQTICANINTVTLAASFTNAIGMSWSSSGTGTFSPSNTNANCTYTPSATDKTAGTVTLTAMTTGTGICAAVTNSLVLAIKPLPSVTVITPPTICSGTSTAIPLSSSPTGATFAWTASGTPTGFSNSSGNTISQTLTGNGTVTYSVTPTLNACAGTPFNIPVTVQVPVITPAALAPGTLGVSYSQAFSVSSIITTPTWSLIGATPAGLSFSSGGILSGTPTTNTSYNFNIKVAQGACTVTLPYTFVTSTASTTWNGTSWSSGVPNATTDAIIDGDYTTTSTETFTAFNITVNAGNTLTINGTAGIIANGNLINNGSITQKCTATINVTGTTSGNAAVIQQPTITPTSLPIGKINSPYIQGTPFTVSFGTSPIFNVTGLPSGLDLGTGSNSNVIMGSTLLYGNYPLTVTSTSNNNCIASQTMNLIILDLTNPNLKFTQQSLSKTYNDADFTVSASSKSTQPITYSTTSSCATVTNGIVHISCVPPGNIISIVASQVISSQYKNSTDTLKILVSKDVPVVTLYTLPGVIKGNTSIYDYQITPGYVSEAGASISYFQSTGSSIATFDNTTGVITGNNPGTFDISMSLAATQNYTSLDTTFSFTVYDTGVPPTAINDTLVLFRKAGVLGDGTIDLLKNDYGITSHLTINLTDIDIINPGNQNIFYSPPVGTFELNQLTGELIVHPTRGLSGMAKIGYTVTDSAGVVSNIAYVTIEISNLQDLPDLKANEVITPNFDGSNDVLFIAYTDLNNPNNISIYDEAGNIIYETESYQNNWAAKDRHGNEVEAGVYMFVFHEEDDQKRTLRGYIRVVR